MKKLVGILTLSSFVAAGCGQTPEEKKAEREQVLQDSQRCSVVMDEVNRRNIDVLPSELRNRMKQNFLQAIKGTEFDSVEVISAIRHETSQRLDPDIRLMAVGCNTVHFSSVMPYLERL